MKNTKRLVRLRRCSEGGFTLLEYCAGAAVICGVVWVAMSTLGQSMGGMLNGISSWVQHRTSDIDSSGGNPSGGAASQP